MAEHHHASLATLVLVRQAQRNVSHEDNNNWLRVVQDEMDFFFLKKKKMKLISGNNFLKEEKH